MMLVKVDDMIVIFVKLESRSLSKKEGFEVLLLEKEEFLNEKLNKFMNFFKRYEEIQYI